MTFKSQQKGAEAGGTEERRNTVALPAWIPDTITATITFEGG
jgi:hypothetical protein